MTAADPAQLARTLEAFYGPLAASADPARRVGWESGAAHRLRLAAIIDAVGATLAADEGSTLLDVGCGEGALVAPLRAQGFRGAYRGEDVLPAMISAASAAHPRETFAVVADGFAAVSGPSARATAVVCSGALNTRVVGDHDAWVERALTTLWARADAIVAIDLAVLDRHPPGVGLACADLGRAWSVARRLAPVVTVREDVLPGEALLVLARSRDPAWRRFVPEAEARGELLLAAGEATLALSLAGENASLRGRALAALGRLDEAERTLGALPTPSDADVVARAQVAWRAGRKAACEALLRGLAARSDEGRAQLVALLLARGRVDEAGQLCATIQDRWIRRELEARFPAR